MSDIPEGTQFGASAAITCKPDYVFDGDDSLIRCLDGPTWSSYPQCIRGTAYALKIQTVLFLGKK